MLLWRLVEDFGTILEGSCISESQYRQIYYTEKPLFEMITDEDQNDLIEVDEKNYCEANGVKRILFYNTEEVVKFKKKLKYAAYSN